MWQRFTEGARTAILYAQEEAGKANRAKVGREHLLLGLLRDDQTVAALALNSFGASYEKVVAALNRHGDGEAALPAGEPMLAAECKHALEVAADSARSLRHNEIGTGHLLLALLPDKPGLMNTLFGAKYDTAASTLRDLGVNFSQLRSQIEENLHLELSHHEYKGPQPPAANHWRGTLIKRYLTPDFVGASGVPTYLEALDIAWATLTQEKEIAISFDSYEVAAELRAKAEKFEQEFERRARELGLGSS